LTSVPTGGLGSLSAVELAQHISSGTLTAEAVTQACLDRIAAREPKVKAFAFLDTELALTQARRRDAEPSRGLLHGVPIVVKDVLDTADMPTEMGSPIYAGHQPGTDATCVALARAAGAVILGKTVTCEFAGVHPGPTTNPINPAHTPGGSSSGSAAAVADAMAPLAFGSQTGGSVLRPAAFCGIVGFKPSFGTLPREGLKAAVDSFDTIGVMGRSVADVSLFMDALLGRAPVPSAPLNKPRIGLCRTPWWPTAELETVEAVEDAAARLAQGGAALREVKLPIYFDGLMTARETINAFERSETLNWEWTHHRAQISPRMVATIEQGRAVPEADYQGALYLTERCRAALGSIMSGLDALLVPCVSGKAPAGLEHTGDTRFQALWTMLHVPAISLPTHGGLRDLPVGIQLVAPIGADDALLRVAQWAMDKLVPWRQDT
jgi:Asp-tRNA(Asn)/Glu-tRNA(Gln) amidotransferase A subunit family amidase